MLQIIELKRLPSELKENSQAAHNNLKGGKIIKVVLIVEEIQFKFSEKLKQMLDGVGSRLIAIRSSP